MRGKVDSGEGGREGGREQWWGAWPHLGVGYMRLLETQRLVEGG